MDFSNMTLKARTALANHLFKLAALVAPDKKKTTKKRK
jgi:hypothetical protein